MGNFKDLTGKTFGRLTVIERTKESKNGRRRWICQCECGNITEVKAQSLRDGHTKSCGCLHKKHGLSNSRLFRIWCHMKDRCYNQNHIEYHRYGGRGISLCESWKNDFISFHNWAIENGYNDTLSIDRINIDGNYCPENCRWATTKMQNNNRSTNHYITYKNKTQSLSQWADEIGIKSSVLQNRINRYHWDIERALTEPAKK